MTFFKKTLLILSLGMLSMAAAQKVDSKAKNILDETSANYKSKSTMYFKFVYGMGNNGKVSKNQTGIFYTSKNKYKLKIMGDEQIFDGNKVYNINAEDMEVTIAKPNGSEAMLSPINYLDSYKKDYNISYTGNKNNLEVIKLTPTKKTGIQHVLLHINKAKKQIEKIEQYADNNDITTISISQYKENLKVDSSTFSFNKNLYKNYLITEL